MKFFLLTILLSFGLTHNAFSEVLKLQISPNYLSMKTRQIKGPHIALVDPSATANGLLLITIGGTNSTPAEFKTVHEEALKLGYHVLAIDYPNDVISTTCRESKDILCFDNFRKEVMFGVPVSNIVNVDQSNSLMTRIEMLVKFMSRTNPQDGFWDEFTTDSGEVDWKKVVAVGHSQGSGHAAYLGKVRELHGVITTAGPQDRFLSMGVAPWIKKKGLTSSGKHLALLHYYDFFDINYQLETNIELTKQTSIYHIENQAPAKKAKILIAHKIYEDPHNDVITKEFNKVWEYLLTEQLFF